MLSRTITGALLGVGLLGLAACGGNDAETTPGRTVADRGNSNALGSEAARIARERDLRPEDITAALKTFMPSGRHDDYYMFASAGHAGQVFVIGLPSMRILKTIAVYTPEAWQGWGFGVGNDIMAEGAIDGKVIT